MKEKYYPIIETLILRVQIVIYLLQDVLLRDGMQVKIPTTFICIKKHNKIKRISFSMVTAESNFTMKKTVLLSFLILLLFNNASALTYTVNSTSDASSGSGTTGTLRWCITQANSTGTADIINFSIAGTFNVGSNYPVITQPLTINGFSAPGAIQGALGTATRVMKIILNGPGSSSVYGLQITASNCTISGLVIQDFYKGIYINGGDNNWIWGNYIGTANNGLSVSTATRCYDDGIALNNNANNNIIGTDGDGSNDANEGNLVSANGDASVQFVGECIAINEGGSIGNNCTGNRIAGNYLGTNETGTAALFNNTTAGGQRGSGVQINYSTANIIGTNGDGISDALERNVISGNTDCGIVLVGGGSNKIKGNYIGTTKTGLVGLPNYADGGSNITAVQISIKTGSNDNIIGTDGDGVSDDIEGNIIGSITISAGSSNSYNYAVFIYSSTGTRIAGNHIGIGADGLTALNIITSGGSYTDKGIYVASSNNTIVGTNGDGVSDAYEANYFGNTGCGTGIDNSSTCVVAGNYFGLGTNLTTAEPLYETGVYLVNSTWCRIGSSAFNNLERNYFCNAGYSGVWVDGYSSANNDRNDIRYNTIGLRPDNAPAANEYHGIEISYLSNANTVQYNIISQNGTITPDGTYTALLVGGLWGGQEASGCTLNNNTIYKNIGRGIDILGNLSVNNKISQNSIYNNGSSSNSTAKYKLGIDLGWDNVTANDDEDPDTGPNGYLNFPIITGVIKGGSSCTQQVSGTYNGLPNTQYYIEVFTSDVCNGDTAGTDNYYTSGYNYGEGKTYQATSAIFTTDDEGDGNWVATVTLTGSSGDYLTAVAIQNNGSGINNTSEFSQCYWVKTDFGDAPDTYRTLWASCGAMHSGGNTNLKIGATIDFEDDGQPTPNADGDGSDEDGITTLPALTVKSTSYTLANIPVTNTTGSTATLYAWIDFNVNGSFESSEFTSATVANGATTATLTWNLASFTCGTSIVPGNAYLRMRLTTDVLTDNGGTTNVDERSYGIANNGEVEDYKIYISGYDYGDLPNTYPTATILCYEDTATAKVWAGVTRPSRECSQKYSPDATGDGMEEDGLTTSIGPSGSSYNWVIRLNANQAGKTVYFGLWLDWDGNGNFSSAIDAFYSGSAVVTGVTNTNVSVYSPYGIYNSGFRLIVSDAPLTSGMYNATINNGEIEDYLLLKILSAPGNILMGTRQAAGNLLRWKNSASLPVVKYVLERSSDNLSWSTLNTLNALLSNDAAIQYSYSDVHPYKQNYYRLKLLLADGTYQYSNIITLFDDHNNSPVIIYPNPVVNKLIIFSANNDYNNLKIVDLTGRVEINQKINSVNTEIDVSHLSSGPHFIKFIKNDGAEEIQKFVKK